MISNNPLNFSNEGLTIFQSKEDGALLGRSIVQLSGKSTDVDSICEFKVMGKVAVINLFWKDISLPEKYRHQNEFTTKDLQEIKKLLLNQSDATSTLTHINHIMSVIAKSTASDSEITENPQLTIQQTVQRGSNEEDVFSKPFKIETKIYDSISSKYLNVIAKLSHSKGPESKVYILVDQDAGTELGKIEFDSSSPDYLYIVDMKNTTRLGKANESYRSEVRGVGTALHELAFKLSLRLGYKGQIKLQPDYGSDIFHWKAGFRYVYEGQASALGINDQGLQLAEYIQDYLSGNYTSEEDKKDLESAILEHEMYISVVKIANKIMQFLHHRNAQSLEEICKNGLRGYTYNVLLALEKETQTGQTQVVQNGGSMYLCDEKIKELEDKFKIQ